MDGVGLPVAVVINVVTVTLAGEPVGIVVSTGGGTPMGIVGESVRVPVEKQSMLVYTSSIIFSILTQKRHDSQGFVNMKDKGDEV